MTQEVVVVLDQFLLERPQNLWVVVKARMFFWC